MIYCCFTIDRSESGGAISHATISLCWLVVSYGIGFWLYFLVGSIAVSNDDIPNFNLCHPQAYAFNDSCRLMAQYTRKRELRIASIKSMHISVT